MGKHLETRRFRSLVILGMLVLLSLGLWQSGVVWATQDQSPARQTVPTRIRTSVPGNTTEPSGGEPQTHPSPTSEAPTTATPTGEPIDTSFPSLPTGSPTPVRSQPTPVTSSTPIPTLPLVIPVESVTPVPSPTPTALPTSALDLAKQPLPPELYNKILFLVGPRRNPKVWVMDPDGSNVGLLTKPEFYNIAKARDTFSMDFQHNAYNALDPNGILQVWSQDLYYSQSLPQQMSFLKRGLAYGPSWSPDQKKVAYVVQDRTVQDIYVWDWDAKKSTPLTHTAGYGWWWNQFPSWSPDGKQIVYSSDRGHDATFSELWVMNADGSNAHNIGNGVWDEYAPVWIKWR